MKLKLWYCPVCDIATNNWRICPRCKGAAIHQKFILIPVHDGEVIEKIVLKSKDKSKK